MASSTKPTTSARARAWSLAALAFAAAFTAYAAGRLTYAGYVRAAALQLEARAAQTPRSAARETYLFEAQSRLETALRIAPGDAKAWLALARVRLLQAAGARVMTVSPPLLQAAITAAGSAEALDPADPEAPARIAEAQSLAGAPAAEVAAALSRSYARARLDPALAPWRVRLAMEAWPALNAETRDSARLEACMNARRSLRQRQGYARLAAQAPEAELAAMLRDLVSDPRCLPLEMGV